MPAAPSSQPDLSSSARKGEHSNEPFDSLLGDGMIASGKWMGQSMTAVAEASANKHWSGTFIRLRAEVLVLAALIFLVEKLGFKNLPFVGDALSQEPARKNIVVFFLVVLFLYQLLCWCLRFWLELQETGLPSSYLADFVQRLTAQLNRVDELSQMPMVELQLQNHVSEWQRALADLKEAPRRDLADFASRINDHFEGYRQRLKELQPQDEHPSFDATADRVIATVDRIYQQYLQQAQSAIQTSAEAGQELLQEEQRVVTEIVESRGSDIKRSADLILANSQRILDQIASLKKALTWDKIILGFALPLLGAVSLVWTCIPDIVEDVPVALRHFVCLLTLQNCPL